MGIKGRTNRQSKKTMQLVQYIGVILIASVVYGMVSSFSDRMVCSGDGRTGFIPAMLVLILALFWNANIHELGHLVFGKLAGYRLMSYRVGPLAWDNGNGKMRFSLIVNKGYGGMCAMIAPAEQIPLYKHGMYFAGGILFNLLSAVIFLMIGSMVAGAPAWAHELTSTLAGTAFLLGLGNSLPFNSGNYSTDGKVLCSLITRQPSAKQLIELQQISAQTAAGVRPRDLVVPEPGGDLPQHNFMIRILSYFRALDGNDFESARTYAELLAAELDLVPAHALPAVCYELCFINCLNGNLEQARHYYAKAGRTLQKDKDINGLRVKAYFEYYVHQNSQQAMLYCEQGLAVADRFPLKGQAVMEAELIRSLQA